MVLISLNLILFQQQLETITIDRAGVKNRTYHNTMYRLRTKGPNEVAKFYYLATEGATPLKTFLEVQNGSHRYACKLFVYAHIISSNFIFYSII